MKEEILRLLDSRIGLETRFYPNFALGKRIERLRIESGGKGQLRISATR